MESTAERVRPPLPPKPPASTKKLAHPPASLPCRNVNDIEENILNKMTPMSPTPGGSSAQIKPGFEPMKSPSNIVLSEEIVAQFESKMGNIGNSCGQKSLMKSMSSSITTVKSSNLAASTTSTKQKVTFAPSLPTPKSQVTPPSTRSAELVTVKASHINAHHKQVEDSPPRCTDMGGGGLAKRMAQRFEETYKSQSVVASPTKPSSSTCEVVKSFVNPQQCQPADTGSADTYTVRVLQKTVFTESKDTSSSSSHKPVNSRYSQSIDQLPDPSPSLPALTKRHSVASLPGSRSRPTKPPPAPPPKPPHLTSSPTHIRSSPSSPEFETSSSDFVNDVLTSVAQAANIKFEGVDVKHRETSDQKEMANICRGIESLTKDLEREIEARDILEVVMKKVGRPSTAPCKRPPPPPPPVTSPTPSQTSSKSSSLKRSESMESSGSARSEKSNSLQNMFRKNSPAPQAKRRPSEDRLSLISAPVEIQSSTSTLVQPNRSCTTSWYTDGLDKNIDDMIIDAASKYNKGSRPSSVRGACGNQDIGEHVYWYINEGGGPTSDLDSSESSSESGNHFYASVDSDLSSSSGDSPIKVQSSATHSRPSGGRVGPWQRVVGRHVENGEGVAELNESETSISTKSSGFSEINHGLPPELPPRTSRPVTRAMSFTTNTSSVVTSSILYSNGNKRYLGIPNTHGLTLSTSTSSSLPNSPLLKARSQMGEVESNSYSDGVARKSTSLPPFALPDDMPYMDATLEGGHYHYQGNRSCRPSPRGPHVYLPISISNDDESKKARLAIAEDSSSSGDEDDDEEEDSDEVREAKAFKVAEEIMLSERVFVDVLKLLNEDFCKCVEAANGEEGKKVIPDEQLKAIFTCLPQLQVLNQQLLSELEVRINSWTDNPCVGDVFVRHGPFLKMYSSYCKDYQRMCQTLCDAAKRWPLFAAALTKFQSSDRCASLALTHYMLKPVQRIPQYKLLLDRYLHHLKPSSKDYSNAKSALDIVSSVADHANSVMRQGDDLATLMELQQSLGSQIEIIKPGRTLIKRGELLKLSRKEMQPRYFVLLSDVLLYTTQQPSGSYHLNNTLELLGMKVSRPTLEAYHNEFNIITNKRSFTLSARTPSERDSWLTALQTAIKELEAKLYTFQLGKDSEGVEPEWVGIGGLGRRISYDLLNPPVRPQNVVLGVNAPIWVPDIRVSMCHLCHKEFTVTMRRHHCRACGKVVCSSCSANKAPLEYLQYKVSRCCYQCFDKLYKECEEGELKKLFKSRPPPRPLPTRRGPTQPAHSGYLFLRKMSKQRTTSWKRLWFVIQDMVLYSYRASEDPKPVESQPLLGYLVRRTDESQIDDAASGKAVFELYHEQLGVVAMFYFEDSSNNNEEMTNKWIKVFEEHTKLTECPT